MHEDRATFLFRPGLLDEKPSAIGQIEIAAADAPAIAEPLSTLWVVAPAAVDEFALGSQPGPQTRGGGDERSSCLLTVHSCSPMYTRGTRDGMRDVIS